MRWSRFGTLLALHLRIVRTWGASSNWRPRPDCVPRSCGIRPALQTNLRIGSAVANCFRASRRKVGLMALDRYARRRMVARLAVALPALAVAANFSGISLPLPGLKQPSALFASPEDPSSATASGAARLLRAELGRASAQVDTANGYRGFRPSEGVLAASSSTAVVVASVVQGSCYFAGLIPGAAVKVVLDETAEACNPSSVSALQASLRSQDGAILAASRDAAATELLKLTSQARFYALGVTGGSFEGVAKRLQIPEQNAIASDKDLRLRSTSSGLCWEVTVTLRTASSPRRC